MSARARWTLILVGTAVTYLLVGLLGVAALCSIGPEERLVSSGQCMTDALPDALLVGPFLFVLFFMGLIPNGWGFIPSVAVMVLAGWWAVRTVVRGRVRNKA